jgi:hypothetical protein
MTLQVDYMTKEEIKTVIKKKLKHVETRMSYVNDRLYVDFKCSHHRILEALKEYPWFERGCVRPNSFATI